jgi:hypothetical protein
MAGCGSRARSKERLADRPDTPITLSNWAGPLQLGYPGLATTLKPGISAMPGAVNATPADCRMP